MLINECLYNPVNITAIWPRFLGSLYVRYVRATRKTDVFEKTKKKKKFFFQHPQKRVPLIPHENVQIQHSTLRNTWAYRRKPPLDLQSWFFLFLRLSLNHSVSGNLRNLLIGASLVVQWMRPCALNAKEPGSIPDEGTRSHMLQMRLNMLQLKIPHAPRKIEDPMWCNLDLGQPNK